MMASKGGDKVEPRWSVEGGDVVHLEAGVDAPERPGLALCSSDRGFREVETCEPAGGEGLGHEVDGVPLATADVGDVDTGGESFDRIWNQREDAVE